MITLPERPRLVHPTIAVKVSYLTGEQADCVVRGLDDEWLALASKDFDAHVAERATTAARWGVPSTIFWYVSGPHYLGTLVVRHRLTPELLAAGGHVGYHVVTPWQNQGHATRMLADGLAECRRLGLVRVLVTCDADNEWSRRVIVTNGGQQDETLADELRFWIDT